MKPIIYFLIIITLIFSGAAFAQDDIQKKLNQNIYTTLRLQAQKELLDSQLQTYIKEYNRQETAYSNAIKKLLDEKAKLEAQIRKKLKEQ
jgi:hypothetical protein